MENYSGAASARCLDVTALLAHAGPRNTAAVHVAGVAVECRLKELIVAYHMLSAWGAASRRARDPMYRKVIARPGHSLIGALRLMGGLYKKAKADPQFLTHLNAVTHPTGATDVDFIALRYSADDISSTSMVEWRRSFEYVLGWLKKNERVTP